MKRVFAFLLAGVICIVCVAPLSINADDLSDLKGETLISWYPVEVSYEKDDTSNDYVVVTVGKGNAGAYVRICRIKLEGKDPLYKKSDWNLLNNLISFVSTQSGVEHKVYEDEEINDIWVQPVRIFVDSADLIDIEHPGVFVKSSLRSDGWNLHTDNIMWQGGATYYKYGNSAKSLTCYASIFDKLEEFSGAYLEGGGEGYLYVIDYLVRMLNIGYDNFRKGGNSRLWEVQGVCGTDAEVTYDESGFTLSYSYWDEYGTDFNAKKVADGQKDLEKFNELLNELVGRGENLESVFVTSLSKLVEKLQEFKTEIDKEVREREENEQVKVFAKEFAGMSKNSSQYDRWDTVLRAYILGLIDEDDSITDAAGYRELSERIQEANPEIPYSLYTVKNFSRLMSTGLDFCKVVEAGVGGSKDVLTVEEYLRLQSWAYNACISNNRYFAKYPDSTGQRVLDSGLFEFLNGGYGNRVEKAFNGRYSRDTVEQVGRSVINATVMSELENDRLGNAMLYFNELVRFISLEVYGFSAVEDATVSSEQIEVSEEAGGTLFKDVDIYEKSLKFEEIRIRSELGYGDYYVGSSLKIPRLSNISLRYCRSEEALKAYRDLMLMLQLADTYARNSSGLEEVVSDDGSTNSGAKKYTYPDLDKYIAERDSGNVVAEVQPALLKRIKRYVSICDGLEYLGVARGALGEELRAIYDYYNKIVQYEDLLINLKEYASSTDQEPLSMFFSVADKQFSYYYNIGVSLSATFIPMQTNLYDVNSLQYLEDASFVEQFHYPYGFYRKGLLIDTDVNAAVNRYVTGQSGSLRYATLADLLVCEKDIVLYVDDNFYNVDTLADLRGVKYDQYTNMNGTAEEEDMTTGYEKFLDFIGFDQDEPLSSVVKTNSYHVYNVNVKKAAAEYRQEEGGSTSKYILNDDKIDQYLTGYSSNPNDKVYNEYTVWQPFAVTSAIYAKSSLFQIINEESHKPKPVFISSPNLAAIEGVGKEDFNSIYNYIMLKNLEGNMSIDYKTTLDLDSLIYIDIYGNILTESGLVIIPAASNPTLQASGAYNVYTAGFLSLCDNGFELSVDYNNSEKYMGGYNKDGTVTGMFVKNVDSGTWQPASKRVNDVYIGFRNLSLSNNNTMLMLMKLHQQSLATNKNMNFGQRAYIITEVLRGAPLEFIRKEFEGMSVSSGVSPTGVYLAYKLEELAGNLFSTGNGNSLVTFPNLAFLDNYEVLIMFAYKLAFAAAVVLLFIKIYMDAVQRRLGLRTMLQFVWSMVLFVIVLFIVPILLDFSYYSTNKLLLQKEATYISALNMEKRNEGREIGVTEVAEPSSKTVLYLKLGDIDVPWYKAVRSILTSDSFATMSEIYEDAVRSNLMSGLPGIVVKSNGLYMDVSTVLDTTKIQYDSDTEELYNIVGSAPYASYVSPYYAILDMLVARVNEYNEKNEVLAYTTAVQSKGSVRTAGLIKAFFESQYFMEQSQDVLGLKEVYGIDTNFAELSIFSDSDIERMQRSLWYSEESKSVVEKRLDELAQYARNYIAENRGMLGKVSDETFLKSMALALAVKHNSLFRIPAADGIEIFDVDTRDIIRLSLVSKARTMVGASKSFARFVYDEEGALGVIATFVLVVAYFIVSILKPITMLVMLVSMVAGLVVRRLFKKGEEHVVEGFLISLLLLCGVNIVYALCLKLVLSIAALNIPVILGMVIQVCVQAGYSSLMLLLLKTVVKDWKGMGYSIYQQSVERISINHFAFAASETVPTVRILPAELGSQYKAMRRTQYYNKKQKTKGYTGRNVLEMMKKRDEEKERWRD